MMASEVRPKRKPGYQVEMIDGEVLLYHLNETRITYLNQPASLIWGLCDGEHSLAEITEMLSQAYPDAAETIPADVHETVQRFVDLDCVELA